MATLFYRDVDANHTIFLTSVQCQGYEDHLIHCRHDYGENVCTYDLDVLLFCGMFLSTHAYHITASY